MSKYSEKNFFHSLKYALRGYSVAFKSQNNFKYQCFFAIIAVISALFLNFSLVEYCILALTISTVLILELLNSVIEFMLDSVFKNKYSKLVEMAKDMAAAAVFTSACTAFVIGILLFGNKILALILPYVKI